MVAQGRRGPQAGAELQLFLRSARIEIVAFDAAQSDMARLAWQKFGKGNHPAGLNLGDCCVYALAKATDEPVLCKGDEFNKAGIEVVGVSE